MRKLLIQLFLLYQVRARDGILPKCTPNYCTMYLTVWRGLVSTNGDIFYDSFCVSTWFIFQIHISGSEFLEATTQDSFFTLRVCWYSLLPQLRCDPIPTHKDKISVCGLRPCCVYSRARKQCLKNRQSQLHKKSVYEFYKVVKVGNFFSVIFQIVMKIIIFLYLNIKSLNYLKCF